MPDRKAFAGAEKPSTSNHQRIFEVGLERMLDVASVMTHEEVPDRGQNLKADTVLVLEYYRAASPRTMIKSERLYLPECVPDKEIETLKNFKQRFAWLVVLLIMQSMSSLILKRFSSLIVDHPQIILFLTMLVGAGGNAGSQSAVLMIRGIAKREFVVREKHKGTVKFKGDDVYVSHDDRSDRVCYPKNSEEANAFEKEIYGKPFDMRPRRPERTAESDIETSMMYQCGSQRRHSPEGVFHPCNDSPGMCTGADLLPSEKEVSLRSFIKHEMFVGLKLATLLSLVSLLRVLLFQTQMAETMAIVISMFFIVMISVLLGTFSPLLFWKLKTDPAHASAALQVVVDVLGVAVVCITATVVFAVAS